MLTLDTPRIMIAGCTGGVGKSLVNMGLIQECRRRGLGVSCIVLGPNLLQATILKRLSNRYVTTISSHLLSAEQITESLYHATVGADIIVMLGEGGLFDSHQPWNFHGSDSSLAQFSKTPISLVVDVKDCTTSVAAQVLGFNEFNADVNIDGVILNRANLAKSDFFRELFDHYKLPQLLGTIPPLDVSYSLPSRVPNEENTLTNFPREFFVNLSKVIRSNLNSEAVLELARSAPAIGLPDIEYLPAPRRCKIAVSEDSCFNILFQDNLTWLRYFGAEIVSFSPLADFDLPDDIQAIYLCGGNLHEYAEEISRNEGLRAQIRDFAANGGIIYSEGAGTSYLAESFQGGEENQYYDGVGVIAAKSIRSKEAFAFCESVTTEETIFGAPGLIIRGISTQGWQMSFRDTPLRASRISYSGGKSQAEALLPAPNIFSTLSFNHFASNPAIAEHLVESACLMRNL